MDFQLSFGTKFALIRPFWIFEYHDCFAWNCPSQFKLAFHLAPTCIYVGNAPCVPFKETSPLWVQDVDRYPYPQQPPTAAYHNFLNNLLSTDYPFLQCSQSSEAFSLRWTFCCLHCTMWNRSEMCSVPHNSANPVWLLQNYLL